MSTDLETTLLQENTEPVQYAEIKEDQDQNIEELKMNDDHENGGKQQTKQTAWFSSILSLESIDIPQQEFKVNGTINIFWKDDGYLLQQFKNCGQNTDQTIQVSSFPIEFQNKLPVIPTENRLFENSKSMVLNKPASIICTSNGSFSMRISIKATFYQKFDIKHYPQDRHALNVKMLFNTEYFTWSKDAKYPGFMSEEFGEENIEKHRWDQRISLSLDEFKQRKEWNLYTPVLHESRLGFFLVSIRIQRNSKPVIYSVNIPLFIVITATFLVYEIDYFSWQARMGFVFLSFIFTAIIDYKTDDNLRYLIFIAYLILVIIVIESVILAEDWFSIEDTDTMDAIDYAAAGVLGSVWLIASIVSCGWWFEIFANKSEIQQKYWKDFYTQQRKNWMKPEYITLADNISYYKSEIYTL